MANNRLTTICECGIGLTSSNIKGNLERCNIPNFYGGRVTHFADLKCECGKEYRGYLKAENNSYKVIDTEKILQESRVKTTPRRTKKE